MAATGSAGVEFLETAAIAYAIARSGYSREAVGGSILGLAIVALAAVLLGQGLTLVSLRWLQVGIGVILLWFGLGWVKKSVRRQVNQQRAGWIGDDPLGAEGITLIPDEAKFSWANFAIMTKSAALEGLEVAVIVVTLGLASGAWFEALGGAATALVLSLLMVILLHPYLVKLPEVLIKLGAGVLLSALGTFWLGEGLGLPWPLGDWAMLALVGLYSLGVAAIIYWQRRSLPVPSP
ncbi:MAG: COG4280 domain-containing protein [Nodosilinea sp.]